MELALARTTRALRAIQDCEAVISQSADESSLLQGICNVVAAAGYRMAWAGMLAHDGSGAITPIGLTGEHGDYLKALAIPLRSGGKGTTAIAHALQSRAPAVVNNFDQDPNPTPWREEALRRGFHSKLVLPLCQGNEVLSILNVYAVEPDAFDSYEIELLRRLADRLTVAVQTHRDRSRRYAAEAALRLRERAIECSANAVVIVRASAPDYAIEYVNPAFEQITGYTAAEAIGREICFMQELDSDQEGVLEMQAALRDQRECRAVLHSRRKDQTPFWYDLHLAPVKDEAGAVTHFVFALHDITPMKQYEVELQQLASHDVLTGLPNRALFQDRLEQALSHAGRNGQSVWVVFVDLDRFKLINDTLGHQAGDTLLTVISSRLKRTLRASDTVARIGGDEFMLVLPERGEGTGSLTVDVLQRIMDAIVEPVTIKENSFVLTCSMGIAVYPADGADPGTLMAHADVAMYRAKELGRNNFQFFTTAMNEQAKDRLRLEAELRYAIERHQLILYYQPQVDSRSGALLGFEALVRWNHPELGMVQPGSFIQVAEETGLIVPIGAWVLRTACAQLKVWHDLGFDSLRVAVNFSACQLAQPDLVPAIAEILDDTGLEARHLEVELTETVVMKDVERNIVTFRKLKELGVQLSVDDFGTGYSSLAYLKRFPIDTLKIDRSFMQDVTVSQDDASIVSSIISLAHNLKLSVIAEGVESGEQAAFLREQKCDALQGFYFSKPVPPDRIDALLSVQKAQDQHAEALP